jgi:hypothetical protein
METLRQSEKMIERRSAVRKLGILGPAAKPAVPALQALLDDPTMKNTVERALERIIGN